MNYKVKLIVAEGKSGRKYPRVAIDLGYRLFGVAIGVPECAEVLDRSPHDIALFVDTAPVGSYDAGDYEPSTDPLIGG